MELFGKNNERLKAVNYFRKTAALLIFDKVRNRLDPFQSSVAFHIETSHLFCSVKQMTGFCMKHKPGRKMVNLEVAT